MTEVKVQTWGQPLAAKDQWDIEPHVGSFILTLSVKDTLDVVFNIYHEPKHTVHKHQKKKLQEFHNKRNVTNRPEYVRTSQTFQSQVQVDLSCT